MTQFYFSKFTPQKENEKAKKRKRKRGGTKKTSRKKITKRIGGRRETEREKEIKAVYTAALVADGWAGAENLEK